MHKIKISMSIELKDKNNKAAVQAIIDRAVEDMQNSMVDYADVFPMTAKVVKARIRKTVEPEQAA